MIPLSETLTIGSVVFARLLAMALLLPGPSGLKYHFVWRVGFALLMTNLLMPVISANLWIEFDRGGYAERFVENLFLGAMVGASIRMLVGAMNWAGSWVSELAGCGARDHMPMSEQSWEDSSPLGRLYGWVALLIFMSIGGPQMSIDALLNSFQWRVTSNSAAWVETLSVFLTSVLAQSFELTLRIGSPVCVALLSASIGLAMIQRSFPQWNLNRIQFAGNWLLLLFASLLTLGSHADFWRGRVQQILVQLGLSP